jgi:hypothetical protein
MTKLKLKKEIHKAIDSINDEVLLTAVYTLLNKVSNSEQELSDDEVRIVEEREANYKSGKTKAITVSEFNKKIRKKFGK